MMKRMPKRVSNSIQRGSVLLESLIAILIFSLGILSLVGLLGASVKDTASSMYRTQASLLANELVGEMWARSQTTTDVPTFLAGYKESAPAETWREKVAETLPGVKEAVNEGDEGSNLPVINVNGNTVTVTVYWQAPGDATAHRYVIATRIAGNTDS